ASREGFVDDHSQRRALVVLRSEIAAAQEPDAHRREIFQADDVRVNRVLILLIGTGAFAAAYVVRPLPALNEEAAGAAAAAHRDCPCEAGGFDARKRFDSLND